MTGVFGTLSPGTATADRYLEVGFTAGTLAAGASTGDLQLRFYRSDWQTLTQSDDYSFSAARTTYGDWTKVAVYTGGSLAWGTPPAGGTGPSPTPTPTRRFRPPTPAAHGVVFDDFAYTGYGRPGHHRAQLDGPHQQRRPRRARRDWPAHNVTFPSIGTGNKALQLGAATDGTGGT